MKAEKQEDGLPEGWVWTTLGETCEVVMGQSSPSETYNAEREGLPFYQGKAEFGDLYPTPVKWCSAPRKIARSGDVLISVRAPVGQTNLCQQPSCIGRGLAAIRPGAEMEGRYILYFLRHVENAWGSRVTGTTFKAISGKVLRQQGIPLAPLPEQGRIVAAIERQLARLGAGVAALKRAQASLKRYKAAVLKAACEGRLTPQDPGDEPADHLLQRILAERRAKWEAAQWAREIERAQKKAARATRRAAGQPLKRGERLSPDAWQEVPEAEYGQYLPENDGWKQKYEGPAPPDMEGLADLPGGWVWASSGQLLEGIDAGHSFRARGRPASPDERGVLKVSAVSWECFRPDENKALFPDTDPGKTPSVRAGDLLISRANTVQLVGAVVLVEKDYPNLLLSDKTLRLVPASNDVSTGYLLYALRAKPARDVFERKARGTSHSMRNLSQATIKTAPVPLPPLPEQHRIVAEIEQRLSVVGELDGALDANLRRAGRLRQSILKRAFEGRLVPQDPEDEPAGALLERIRAKQAIPRSN